MIKLRELLKEVVNGEELVASGMKKVFANAHDTGAKTISYDQVEAVGLGYIKDVSTAQRVAYQTAVQIADKFGYWDDTDHERFVKEDGTAGPVAEVGLNQSPKFGKEKDAVLDYLRMIAKMPDDDAPPLHVWKEVVDSAGIALQHYIRARGWSGLNEGKK
jgi:hypothetical protein